MDLNWLLVVALIMGIVGFLLGRRTSPGGRAVHRLQREIDAREQALTRHQEEASRFVADMQQELEHVSSAYHDLQVRLRTGAEHLASVRQVPMTSPAVASPVNIAPKLLTARADSTATPEWPARLAGSWGDNKGGPSLPSAAACPLPEYVVPEAPKDYPASRRGGNFDEHSYA